MAYRRRNELLNLPSPNYGCVTKRFTVCLRFGGRFHFIPTERYEGGSMAKWDYVELKDLTFETLNTWCDDCELPTLRRFYASWKGGFKIMDTVDDLKEYYDLHALGTDRQLVIYVDLSPSNVDSAQISDHSIDVSVERLEKDLEQDVATTKGKRKAGAMIKGKRGKNGKQKGKEAESVAMVEIEELEEESSDGEGDDSSDSEFGIVPGSDDEVDSCLESDYEDEEI